MNKIPLKQASKKAQIKTIKKVKVTDWAQSKIYKLVELNKAKDALDNFQDIFNEQACNYNYSILKKMTSIENS